MTCTCKRENMRVTYSEKIALTFVGMVLFISLGVCIYLGLTTRTVYGICSVAVCTDIVIFYSLPGTNYSSSFIIPSTWNITCIDNIVCSYSPSDPYGTFGGWIDRLYNKQIDNICMNGACLMQNTLNVKVLFILVVFCISMVMFIGYIVTKVLCRPPKKRFESLYKAIDEKIPDEEGDLDI